MNSRVVQRPSTAAFSLFGVTRSGLRKHGEAMQLGNTWQPDLRSLTSSELFYMVISPEAGQT